MQQAPECVAAGAQALLAEKARLAAEHAEMQQRYSLLLARLQLAEDSGAGLREGSPCSPLGEPAGAQDLPAEAYVSPDDCPPAASLREPAGAQGLPAKAQGSPGARAAALAQELELIKGQPAGAQDLPADAQESPGARAAALAQELELMKGMLIECAPATIRLPMHAPPTHLGEGAGYMHAVIPPCLPAGRDCRDVAEVSNALCSCARRCRPCILESTFVTLPGTVGIISVHSF